MQILPMCRYGLILPLPLFAALLSGIDSDRNSFVIRQQQQSPFWNVLTTTTGSFCSCITEQLGPMYHACMHARLPGKAGKEVMEQIIPLSAGLFCCNIENLYLPVVSRERHEVVYYVVRVLHTDRTVDVPT